MADFETRSVNTKFSGLTTTVAIFGVVGLIALTGFESLRQLRRLPKVRFAPIWKRDERASQGGRGGILAQRGEKGDVDASSVGADGVGSRDKLTCEDWEMGHLYTARTFHATTPSPPMAKWPFMWAWQALKFDDWFYATHTGMDTVVYVRFLRGCMYWMLLQTLTTAPILLAVHLHFAKESGNGGQPVVLNDMSQASLSYLVTTTVCHCTDGTVSHSQCPIGVRPNATESSTDRTDGLAEYEGCEHLPNEKGRKLLWIHLCLLWFITFTWIFTLWWIGKGSLRVRWRWVEELRRMRQSTFERRQKRNEEQEEIDSKAEPTDALQSQNGAHLQQVAEGQMDFEALVRGDDSDGWRQRTLLVTNLPPTMRDEASIRRYFEEFLRPDDASIAGSDDDRSRREHSKGSDGSDLAHERLDRADPSSEAHDDTKGSADAPVDDSAHLENAHANNSNAHLESANRDNLMDSPVQTVVLVRKMNELSAMLSRRQEVLAQLEAAHIKLAKNVMLKIGKSSALRENGVIAANGAANDEESADTKSETKRLRLPNPFHRRRGAAPTAARRKGAKSPSGEKERQRELVTRLARFTSEYRESLSQEDREKKGDKASSEPDFESIWEALAEVPRELLDPYQPVTRLSSLFRGQKVPTIDYLLTKLNLLTALVTEMRARPPSSYEPTSTAFVTFRDPRQARMVWRELKTQIVVKVRLAPEVKDLDWDRLMRTSFTGDIVRGFGVNTFFWIFTVLWVVPVGLLTTSLFSVDKLEKIFPAVQSFFMNNPRFEGFISVTLPTLIVSLLTMAVPEVIFQISKRAQGFVTFSALYDQCLCRYWKFVICNVVIFFCVGATTIQGIIFQLGTSQSVLNSIAFAFPTAAPFYISYFILGMGIHSGFELVGFMVPLIQHMGARNATTPRARAVRTLPRNFNRYYWLPFHILIISIIFVFALLNPLVIPFALAYLWVALIVFKKNFAYQYFRRFNEKEGVVYFTRLFRFSLDGLLVGQIVILIFFSVTKQEAVYIALTAVLLPINIAVKLLGTRLWKSQCRAVEDEEANAVCGIESSRALTSPIERKYLDLEGGQDAQATTLSRMVGPSDARASGRYPAIATIPPSGSRLAKMWQKIHNSFNANGHDFPSYVNGTTQHNERMSAKTITQAMASAPIAVAKRTATKSRHLAQATATNVPASDFNLRKSLALSSTFPQKREQETPPQKTAKSDDPLAETSAGDFKRILEGGDEPQVKFKTHVVRSTSAQHPRKRSEGHPFLSGYETIACHAPVISGEEEISASYGDGEFEEMLSLRRREFAAERRRRRSLSRRSVSQGGPDKTQDTSNNSGIFQNTLERSESTGMLAAPLETEESADAAGHSVLLDTESSVVLKPEAEADKLRELVEEDEWMDGGPLVRPHAQVRWDDTPNNHARYHNPFYSVELDPFLWLPRDPLAPIDLCDTIEWHGLALVSSQGGDGEVGEWDEEGDDEDAVNVTASTDAHDAVEGGKTWDSTTPLIGDEEIHISGVLAQRIQEAEDVDDVADPAASIPRNLMDDYKKILEENAEAEEELDELGPTPTSPRMTSPRRRRSSASRRSASLTHEPLLSPARTHDHLEVRHALAGETLANAQSSQELRVPTADEAFSQDRRRDASLSHRSLRSILSVSQVSVRASQDQPRPQRVTMQRALKAEVLEEEFLRVAKEKAAMRSQRQSDNTFRLSTVSSREGGDLEKGKNAAEEATNTENASTLSRQQSDIMARHMRERSRMNTSPSRSSTFRSPKSFFLDRKEHSQALERRDTGHSQALSADTSEGVAGIPASSSFASRMRTADGKSARRTSAELQEGHDSVPLTELKKSESNKKE